MNSRTLDLPAPPAQRSLLARMGAVAVPIGFVQVAVLYAVLAMKPVASAPDPDFWWHLRLGETILDSGLPRHDPYSWTMRGEPFVAHEWLSEVVIAAVQRGFGYWGNIVVFDAIAIGALLVGYVLAYRLGVPSLTRTLLSLVAVAAMIPFITVRPQAFTWLLFAVTVYLLTLEPWSRRTALLLPAILILWANLHLGFVYGLIAVGLFMVGNGVDALRGRPSNLRHAALLLGACVVATFVNPHGPEILTYPLTYADDREALSIIAEWRSPITNPNLMAAPYYIAVLLMVARLPAMWKRSTFHVLLALVFLAFSFGAARNVAFVALLLVPLFGGGDLRPAVAAKLTSMRGGVAAPMLAMFSVLVLLIAVRLGGGFGAVGKPNDRDYPREGTAYLQEHLQDARVYNNYTWGGYMLWAAPDVPVFIDGRSDFYGGDFVGDWAAIGRLEPGWEELMESYGIDAAFINSGSRLARELRTDPRWEEVFVGKRESIFVLRTVP